MSDSLCVLEIAGGAAKQSTQELICMDRKQCSQGKKRHTKSMRLLRGLSSVVLLWCAGEVDAATKRILHISDVHLNLSTSLDPAESAQIPVRYLFDSPASLLESALAYASQVIPNPELLLYTGDHVSHGRTHSSEYVRSVVEKNVQMIDKFFPSSSSTLRVTAIVGNSDSNPGYYMDVDSAGKPVNDTNPTLEQISRAWSEALPADKFEAFTHRGFLTYELDPKLTIVTLNTVQYSPKHLPASSSLQDPLGQFVWLNDTLRTLREEAKFAYIAGHIPPIVDSNVTQPMWQEHYIRKYQDIVSSYPDVVKAQFFGHVHSVEFRIPLDSLAPSSPVTDQSESPLFVSGSISPLFGNNPSFIVWEFDDETYDMADYVVHSTSNISASEPLVWKPLFRASEVYKTLSLATASLKDLRARMRTDRALFDAYYWNMKAQAHNLPSCESVSCRARFQCSLTWWPTRKDFYTCVDTIQGHGLSSQLPPSHALLGIVAVVCAYSLVCVACFAFKRLRRKGRVSHMSKETLKMIVNVSPEGDKEEIYST